eukprot:TRINITY_DN21799_c0_g1_i1.p1 TRINITY_DN21799_c0_g1~~TRINITY_DN21799_c0_g1_i1.p1  ORF type:complete len:148 (-),score=1.86 TRINITY_DN21799_c0_g1_i1:31-474(-)
MAAERLKDHSKESRTFKARAVLAFFVVIVMLCVLVVRLYYLQVIEHDRYAAMSEANRVQLQPVPPTRGLIYDRNGVLLADNRPSYSVTILKEEVSDLDATLAELQSLIPLTDCLLYTSDAADEEDSVDLGGRRILNQQHTYIISCSD